MNRQSRHIWLGTAAAVLVLGFPAARAANADEPSTEIPAALAPFEHLIGGWKGVGIPTANRIEGWPEKHAWAWVFDQGRPVGLAVTLTGDKTLAKGRLTFDKISGDYQLSGNDPMGEPVVFKGKLDDDRQTLTLLRQGQLAGGTEQRLTLRLITNKIRYVIWDDRQEAGAPRFARFIEVKMGKEGEAFAAGAGGAANLPKCILTGGAATMTVSYQGKTYPVCCTGCRDEFQTDPEKYVKKAALHAAAAAKDKPAAGSGISRVGKDDGSFDALLDDSPSTPRGKAKDQEKSKPKPKPKEEARPAPEKPADSGDANDSRDALEDKAAALLKKAQGLEKDGKGRTAAIFYKIILQDHPKSPQAKTAAARLTVLEKK